ncbi:glycosyltransferase [Stieleria sp. TO1_6]|uniref:glycosyltransferase n=1 Tax=Stieleria tagensis TaxID=2956795 RepID=UPI00209AAD16|nr:glycosyltransferase [Stieleria tagensis]MCO8122466.1 glycosyltransferase [Stieleria tagensis]
MPAQSSPRRVLLMVSSMRGGGSERQVLLLARHLDRNRFQPHLYLTEAAGDFLDQVPADVPIHSFDSCADPGGIYLPGRQLRRQTEFLRQVIQQQRIDVIYDRTFHMTMIAGKAAGGVRRVATIVSPPHLAVPLVESRFVALKRRRLAAAYRSADVVIAVSRQAARSAESYYRLPPQSIVVIHNPVDFDGLSGHHATRRTDHADHADHRSQLVCVGRMTPEKGQADLIDALAIAVNDWPASVGQVRLRLIGDGPLRGDLASQVSALGLSDRVTFLGAQKDAAAEIAAAGALVLPSRFEGLPNVMLEAMALGTPVIATRAGGAVELQRDQPTAFWADVASPPSLAAAILEFANHPDRSIAHTEAAQRLIQSEHNVPHVVQQIEDLLDPKKGKGVLNA